MQLQNTSGTEFHLDVTRGVRLLGNSRSRRMFGAVGGGQDRRSRA